MTRNNYSMTKATVFITLIVTLNLVGVSYGHWQGDLTNVVRVSSGYIKPEFYGKVKIKDTGGFIKSKASMKGKNSSPKYMLLMGEIEKDTLGSLKIDYKVVNSGSLPIEFDESEFEKVNQGLDGIRIHKKPSAKTIKPNDKATDSIVLKVDASKEEYNLDFEIKLPYKQHTD